MNGQEKVKSGFVALAGRPNVGKSTLLNRLVGEKVTITSPRPQTTRNRIIGIMSRPGMQIVFVDTPGIMKRGSAFNRYMIDVSVASSAECDMILFMTDAEKPDYEADRYALERIGERKIPMILVLNKIDLVKKPRLLEQIGALSDMAPFREVFPISARTGEGVDEMLQNIKDILPEGPMFYPSEMTTDQPEDFLFGEIIREKAFMALQQELPYSTAVMVDKVEDKPGGVTVIYATIYVERSSQKGIMIGKGGAMLKKIGATARRELERRLGVKVFLDLKVSVKEKWTTDAKSMSRLGYKKDI